MEVSFGTTSHIQTSLGHDTYSAASPYKLYCSMLRLVVGAPKGTYPGGLYLNNPSCTGNPPQRNGLVYLCSIQPGKEICDGAVGNGTTNNGRLFDCIGTCMRVKQMAAVDLGLFHLIYSTTCCLHVHL